MDTPLIAFIGAGNMAASIIGGLVESGHPAQRIRAADPYPPSLENLRGIAPVEICDSNADAVSGADVVILAVKPQVMAEALESITAALGSAVVISIAAGITTASMQSRLGPQAAIVRCMPNTPALLGSGASALFATPQTSPQQRDYAQAILEAVGICCWVSEEQALDAITALSGSGPAYFFLFMESMIAAGCKLGLDRATATRMTMQTALGAARMGQENDLELTELRRRVTSPGGTTESALRSFQQDDLPAVVQRAMTAAAERAAEMAREMG